MSMKTYEEKMVFLDVIAEINKAEAELDNGAKLKMKYVNQYQYS